MKSIVEYYTPTKEIPVPDHYFEIEIKSWDEVIQPLLEEVANRYGESDASDDMIEALGLAGVTTVPDFKQYAKEYYESEYISFAFYNKLMPYILAFY